MIAWENPRFSGGNAAAPSCVDMNKRLVRAPRPAPRERQAWFRRAVRNTPAALAVTDESPGKRRGKSGSAASCGREE
jgi:hypothetical protein